MKFFMINLTISTMISLLMLYFLLKDKLNIDSSKGKTTETKDPDVEIERKRQFVKTMMKEAWYGYVRHAWGFDELSPLNKSPSDYGSTNGLTIIDSMDTLLIMGLDKEFQQGRKWIEEKFHFENENSIVSVFETIIRFVGGFLSCYALTGDRMFLEKAKGVSILLLPAYKTQTGLSMPFVNPKTGRAFGRVSVLAELGSQHLEFVYLSDMTNDSRFRDKVIQIRNKLNQMVKPNGLYMDSVDNKLGTWSSDETSLGALSDSYYEYLLKSYIQSNHRDYVALKMYVDAMDSICNSSVIQVTKDEFIYLAKKKRLKVIKQMEHLACFAGGMFSLGAHEMGKDISVQRWKNKTEIKLNKRKVDQHMAIGANITNTCHESYKRTPTGIGPEIFDLNNNTKHAADRNNAYLLRPEVVESYFILWRLTNDTKYRKYAWEAVEAIHKYCRTKNGYSGLENVMNTDSYKDDHQQSFFLAETLKYLYLIFSSHKLIPLDQWVFNTEGHPFPICGNNQAYPTEKCNQIFA